MCRPYLLRKLARHASPSDRLQTLKTSEMRTVNTPRGGSVKCMTGNLRRSSALFSVKRALWGVRTFVTTTSSAKSSAQLGSVTRSSSTSSKPAGPQWNTAVRSFSVITWRPWPPKWAHVTTVRNTDSCVKSLMRVENSARTCYACLQSTKAEFCSVVLPRFLSCVV